MATSGASLESTSRYSFRRMSCFHAAWTRFSRTAAGKMASSIFCFVVSEIFGQGRSNINLELPIDAESNCRNVLFLYPYTSLMGLWTSCWEWADFRSQFRKKFRLVSKIGRRDRKEASRLYRKRQKVAPSARFKQSMLTESFHVEN